jgi:hypothetical protein
MVGAFVGLGLLLYGLIKYKDKWLVMIGAFGILFTIFVYSALFHQMKSGPLFRQGFSQISAIQLKQVVKGIEFYKLQNGQYPDSLQQLLIVDEFAPIHDATHAFDPGSQSFYNYRKIGEKYALFSSGDDGKPGTKDDVYPKIEIRDSSKIGLIRAE